MQNIEQFYHLSMVGVFKIRYVITGLIFQEIIAPGNFGLEIVTFTKQKD